MAGNWAWWAFLLTGMLTVFVYAKLWRRSALDTDPLVELVETRVEVHRDPAAFGEVVVVGTGAIGLDVVSGCGRRAAVDLHAAVHPEHLPQQPPTTVKPQVRRQIGVRPATKLRSMRAGSGGG